MKILSYNFIKFYRVILNCINWYNLHLKSKYASIDLILLYNNG